MLCKEGADVIRKEAWPFYRTISGVSLCWELEGPAGPKGRDRGQVEPGSHLQENATPKDPTVRPCLGS